MTRNNNNIINIKYIINVKLSPQSTKTIPFECNITIKSLSPMIPGFYQLVNECDHVTTTILFDEIIPKVTKILQKSITSNT
jgi:hypothetical protein